MNNPMVRQMMSNPETLRMVSQLGSSHSTELMYRSFRCKRKEEVLGACQEWAVCLAVEEVEEEAQEQEMISPIYSHKTQQPQEQRHPAVHQQLEQRAEQERVPVQVLVKHLSTHSLR